MTDKALDVKVTTPARITQDDLILLQRTPTKVPAIPPIGSQSDIVTCIERIKQIVETREGNRGSFIEKSVTWRDLIGSGLAKIQVDGTTYTPPGGGGIQPPLPPGDTPIYTEPPAPTGLTAIGAMSTIFVEWNNPGYSYHGYAEIWRADSNVLANAVLIGTSTGTIYVDEVTTDVSKYYWVRFISKWNITGPYQGTDGVLATTGADVNYLLEVLEGQITQTQLDATLSAEIDQIDTLAIEVSQLTAGVAGSFDPFKTYYFDSTAEGWIADTAATVSQATGHLVVDSTGTTPSVKLTSDLSPGVSGANYPVVKARIKRVSGSTWSGTLQWKTAGHGFSATYQNVIADPTLAIGDYLTIEWDMSADSDYTASTILNWRIEIGAATDDDFNIDWIAMGRNAPGASVAMVGEETTARIAADSAEVTARQLLSTKVLGTTDPSTITGLNDLASGMVYEEKSARSSADSSLASDITTVETTVNGHTTTLQTQATSINGLSAQYTVKIDSNGYVSGFGLASQPTTGEPGGQISTFGVRADTFYVANPTGPGVPPSMPFIVKTTSWVSPGGITNPPGVYMRDAYIADGQIVNAKIGNLAVDDAKIASLSAGKLNAGTIAADRLDANVITSKVLAVDVAKLTTGIVGGNIYSQSYVAGSGGWVLMQNGSAEMNNVAVRGMINGGAFTGYAWPPINQYGFHLGPNGLLIGNANNNKYVQITSDGNFYAPGLTIINGSPTFSGQLAAAGGTFTGNLSAAGGTFGGSLSAATGTFSGSLTAAAINAVNTINLADNAVIIPATNQQYDLVGGSASWQTILTCSINLPEYVKLYIFANVNLLFNAFGDPLLSPNGWAIRILGHSGENIITMGPDVTTGYDFAQPIVSLGATWAENAGTRTFYLQLYSSTSSVNCFGRSMFILGARKSP